MEKNKKKGKESLIGKIIYGFLMFAPLLAILTTCAVYTMNKEIETPRQEVTVNYKYETNDVNSIDDLIEGNIYHIKQNNTDPSNMYKLYLNNSIYYNLNYKINSPYQAYSQIGNGYYANIQQGSNLYIFNEIVEGYPKGYIIDEYELDIIYYNNITNNLNSLINYISKCENLPIENVEIIEEENTAEKVFYRAINNVEQSNLFNWAENNTLYSGVKATTDLFSINNTFVPMLLTYWLIMSLIYILYDIVLMIFNVIHRKLHEIQETI